MKKYLLLFAIMLFAASGFAQNASILNRIDSKEDFDKRSHEIKDRLQHKIFVNEEQYRDGGVVSTTIFSEDFSKFTAGSEDAPDATRLDDPTTAEIDDAYFNTPGWVGLEVYQAGGCAFIDFSSEYDDTGMLITPLVNTSGNITIKCRVKSVSAEGDLICYNIIDENSDALDLDYTYITGGEWVDIEFPSSYGEENSYVILFAMYDAIFIDDIEIVNHYIPAPTILPETNVTNSGFTANWSPVDGVDDYYFYLYAKHTAQIEETYSFVTGSSVDGIQNGAVFDGGNGGNGDVNRAGCAVLTIGCGNGYGNGRGCICSAVHDDLAVNGFKADHALVRGSVGKGNAVKAQQLGGNGGQKLQSGVCGVRGAELTQRVILDGVFGSLGGIKGVALVNYLNGNEAEEACACGGLAVDGGEVNGADLAVKLVQPLKVVTVALRVGVFTGLAVNVKEVVVDKACAGNLLDQCVDLVNVGGNVFGYGGVKNVLDGGFGDPGLVVSVILAVIQLDQGSVCDLAAALVAEVLCKALLGFQNPVVLFANEGDLVALGNSLCKVAVKDVDGAGLVHKEEFNCDIITYQRTSINNCLNF